MLLLLLNCFSRVWLCVWTAAHQAPPSLGFSRQEHWSGLPFPSPMHESGKWKGSRSVMSDSQWPHGLQPTRLLHPWDFPGNSTGVGCHCLLPCYHGDSIILIPRSQRKKHTQRNEVTHLRFYNQQSCLPSWIGFPRKAHILGLLLLQAKIKVPGRPLHWHFNQ